MKYEFENITIPQEKREDINKKILAVVEGKVVQHDITPLDIFNCYTGKGGLHGLDFSNFDNYHRFSEAKKEYEQGQFFTPAPVCHAMVELVKPGISDLVCDPACGTGNFFNFLPLEQNCFGCEVDPAAVKVARYLYPEAAIIKQDIREYAPGLSFDYVFGNPPFNLDFGQSLSQHFFCLKASELLKPGGLLVLIAPVSFLNDDFMAKNWIEWFDTEFNFVLQYKLSPASFRPLGVENFSTRVMVFQKKSIYLEDKPFQHDRFVEGSSDVLFHRFIKPLKEKNREIRAKLILESRKDKDSFDFKINKLLYQVKVNRKTAPFYARCVEKVQQYRRQKKPGHMKWDEWEKTRITKKAVLSFLKRQFKKQHRNERDKIEFVKRDFGFALKAYSGKKKRLLNKTNSPQYWDMNDLVLSNGLPGDHGNFHFPYYFKKLIDRKKREFEKQDIPFSEMERDNEIDRFLETFRFTGKDDRECRFNGIQKQDLGLCMQKRYSLINWQMGSGKTAAAYAWAKYNMKHRAARNVFIISPAISINLTWVPFLQKHKENFICVQKISDLQKITPGSFVLLSLSRLTTKSKQSADGHPYKIDLYRMVKNFVKRQSYKVGLVFDESDEITNPNARRSKAVLACFRKVRYKLLATGTTTRNNVAELYKQLELLYNNSVNMLCDCEKIYSEVKKDGEVEIKEKDNTTYFNQPFPAYYGNNLFKACFNPSKTTVFGIKKHNQDIYNKSSLVKIIQKTILTRLFKEIAGPGKYEIKSHTLRQNPYEIMLYEKIVVELQQMIRRYYQPCENEKKESMMRLLRQLELLIKATSTPNNFDEYKELFPTCEREDDFEQMPLFRNFKSQKNNVRLPNKYKYIENMIRERSGCLVAVGCLSRESTKMYYNELKRVFPEREIFLCLGKSTFGPRSKILTKFEASRTGILIATQQSLKSSVNIPTCNEVIVEALPWNIPRLLQFCFRFVRYDSSEKSTIHMITYRDTIDMNLFALLLAKERINDFVKTLEFKEQSDIYGEFDVNLDLLDSIMEKKRDSEGKVHIEWGNQKVS